MIIYFWLNIVYITYLFGVSIHSARLYSNDKPTPKGRALDHRISLLSMCFKMNFSIMHFSKTLEVWSGYRKTKNLWKCN